MQHPDGTSDLPSDWIFRVDEVSAGVYEVYGSDEAGRSVAMRGTDPDALVTDARATLTRLVGRENDVSRGDASTDLSDRTLIEAVEQYAVANTARLSNEGIELRYRLSPLDRDKTSVHLALDRLPHATAGLSVWDSGESDLMVAWRQLVDGWAVTIFETVRLGSPDEVRQQLARVEELVTRDGPAARDA